MEPVLIGTPIRDTKQYGIKRWLKSVCQLDYNNYLLYMVDNSDTPDFVRYVTDFCNEIGFTKYEIVHLDSMAGLEGEARLAPSRQKIEEKLISGDFKYWFSWECDTILPSDALKYLLRFFPEFDVVNHTYPDRDDKKLDVGGIGCSVFKREVMEGYSFTAGGGYGQCEPKNHNCYYSGDSLLMSRMMWADRKIVDIHKVLSIEHLGENDGPDE